MSRAASGLVRALASQAADASHRIFLTDVRSVDWQSLTFVGERHRLALMVLGPAAAATAEALVAGLPEREFSIAGHIVADIAGTVAAREAIGSVSVVIEALTIAES